MTEDRGQKEELIADGSQYIVKRQSKVGSKEQRKK